jgi:hypothetical protein
MDMPQTMFLLKYVLNELGVNSDNTKNSEWTRFPEKVTDRNPQNIKNELNINYDSRRTNLFQSETLQKGSAMRR